MEDSASQMLTSQPAVYRRRWYMVLVLFWLNVTNGMLWISYADISDVTARFYHTSVANVNWFSLVFPIVTIVLGMPAFWALDRMGLRLSLNLCSALNLGCATLRLLCGYKAVPPSAKFPLAMVGQLLGAAAQPISMFSPARLAAVWFPPEQRATATTLSALGNPLGVLLGSLLPPIVVRHHDGFNSLAISLFAASLVGALLSLLGVCHSAPPRPPAPLSDHLSLGYNFREQLRLCFSSCQFLILSIAFGVAVGLFSTLSTLLQQTLCPYGYTAIFAGTGGSLLIACGLVGSLLSGLLADRTKALTEIVQSCLVLACLGLVAFSVLSTFSGFEVPILVSLCWIGTFGVAQYSISFELAAEVTYPASENISTGILVVSGQVFSVIFILLSQVLSRPIVPPPVQVSCGSTSDPSLWILNMFMSGCAVLATAVLLLGFRPQYRRRMTNAALISTQEDFRGDKILASSEAE